jgi:uncharacterized protein
MPLTMHQAAFPQVLRMLKALDKILDKAVAHCESRKIDPSVLLNYRIAPDMYPLLRQVQIVTDQAKGMAARLSGQDIPAYPDTESSFAELKARLAKTMDYVSSVSAEAVEGSEDRMVTLKLRGEDHQLSGRDYLFGFMYPNFYFHAATAYDILRHAGVELGKRDFMGV